MTALRTLQFVKRCAYIFLLEGGGGGGGTCVSVSLSVAGSRGWTAGFASFIFVAVLIGAVGSAGTGGGGGGDCNSFNTSDADAAAGIVSSEDIGGGGGGGLLRCVAAFTGAVAFFATFCAWIASPKQITANVASDNFSFIL